MKLNKLRTVAVFAVAGLFATMAPFATNAFAATEPDTTPNSDAPIYLLNNDTSTQYAKGIQLDWGQASGVIASSIPIPTIPTNWDTLRLPAPTLSETKAIAFIAPIGGEKSRSQWKAYGDDLDVDSNGLLMPMITPEFLGKGTPAAVKSAGGNWSLGVAYLAPGNPSTAAPTKAYFTTINVDPGTGTWKFYTPVPPKTTTAASLSVPATATVGATVTLSATVAPAAATGTVTFKEGSTTLGTGTLSGGTATFSTSALAAGSHSIVASYAGDDTYGASVSSAQTISVDKIDTSVSLAVDKASVEAGNNVILTATATPTDTSGNVQFFEDTTSIGSVAISGGTASKTVAVNLVGSHSYTAKVVGNDTFGESALSAAVTVTATAATVPLPPKAPSENALVDSNKGGSASINAANQVTLSGLDSSLNGKTVNVFAYSTPTFLGEVTVTAGSVTVDGSALVKGDHKLAIADPSTTNVLAWASFNKSTEAVVPTITKTVNAEVANQELSDGEFSLVDTSGSSTVTLANPTFVNGQSLSSGSLGGFKVTDLRQATKPGWDLKTDVAEFKKGTDTIDESALGIAPKLIDQGGTGATAPALSTGQTAGSAVYPWNFATLTAGGFSGVTKYDADLTFLAPAGKAAGTYNSTLTLTLVSK